MSHLSRCVLTLLVISVLPAVAFGGQAFQPAPQSEVIYQAPASPCVGCQPLRSVMMQPAATIPGQQVGSVEQSTEFHSIPVEVTTEVRRSANVPAVQLSGTVPTTQLSTIANPSRSPACLGRRDVAAAEDPNGRGILKRLLSRIRRK